MMVAPVGSTAFGVCQVLAQIQPSNAENPLWDQISDWLICLDPELCITQGAPSVGLLVLGCGETEAQREEVK